jgi:hypothetical protein
MLDPKPRTHGDGGGGGGGEVPELSFPPLSDQQIIAEHSLSLEGSFPTVPQRDSWYPLWSHRYIFRRPPELRRCSRLAPECWASNLVWGLLGESNGEVFMNRGRVSE